jgi:subtilisin family serine protease
VQSRALKPETGHAEARVFNFIVRAEVDEDQVPKLRKRSEVAGIFSDPQIYAFINCSPFAVGTHLDVERLLCVPKLKAHGLDGSDVLVAVVDKGINLDYLNAHGKGPNFDRMRSWAPDASGTPGQFPVDHGTMCAFDVCIAAPRCTLLDIALLKSTVDGGFSGFLSDAVRAYEHLFSVMTAPLMLGEFRSMVVTNSWGLFDRSLDLPVGDPGNYSDNINHPFNRSVTALEGAGADILFAAGNCGIYCPDKRCSDIKKTIYGANSHPDVLCVGGVDTTKALVGYSSQGPGCLTNRKPDVCGYTHFKGSEVYKVDSGTSAACPVVAGLVAAFRTRWQYNVDDPETHPVALRHYVTSTAGHGMSLAYDYARGRGVVRGCALVDHFFYDDSPPSRLLHTFLEDFCKQYPELCPPGRLAGQSSTNALPSDVFEMLRLIVDTVDQQGDATLADVGPILAAYLVGQIQRHQQASASSGGGCGCSQASN